MRYFPNIPLADLRREWQHYRHLEPDFDRWLKFMHEERERDNRPIPTPTWRLGTLATVGLVAGLLALLLIAFC